MAEKSAAADPPPYEAGQPQINQGYEKTPPYYPGPQNTPAYPDNQNISTYPGYPNTQGPPGGYLQQPATTVVYNQPHAQPIVVSTVEDNMGLAIFATFCCFWPLGLVAIMRASEVKSALAVNDIPRAQRLSEESRRLSRISIIIGIILSVVIVVVVVAVRVAAINAASY